DEGESRARITRQPRRHGTEDPARLATAHAGHARGLDLPICHDRRRAARQGLGDVLPAVRGPTGEREEDVAGAYAAGIRRNTRDLDLGASLNGDGAEAVEQRAETHQGRAVGWSGRSSSARRRSPPRGVPGSGDCSVTQPVPRTSTVQPSACARVSASRSDRPRKLGVPGSSSGPGTAATSTGGGAGGSGCLRALASDCLRPAGVCCLRPAEACCSLPADAGAVRGVGWTRSNAIVAAAIFRKTGAATTPP